MDQASKKDKREARLARWKQERATKNDEQRQAGQPLRHDVMRGAAGRAFAKAAPETQCRRCGMHACLGRGQLEKHHAVAIRDGGHPHDPANLHTLCYFCHREWHTWWEGALGWSAYMGAEPYCQVVLHATPARNASHPSHGDVCRRCGISAGRCGELRKGRKPFQAFERARGHRDQAKRVCYW